MMASAWMALSSMLFSFQNLFAKLSGQHVDFWTVTFFRGCVGTLLSIIVLMKKQSLSRHEHDYRMLCTRGLLGGVTIVTSFLSLIECSLSEATVLMSTSPLWSNLFTKREDRIHCLDWLYTAVSLSGIVVITYPIEWTGKTGPFFALCSAWSQAIVNLAIRNMRKEDPHMISLFSMSASALLCVPGIFYTKTAMMTLSTSSPITYLFLVLTGVFSFAGQTCKTISLQVSPDISILTLRYLDIVFAVLIDTFLFRNIPTPKTWLGMMLVCSGCIAILVTGHKKTILPLTTVAK